MLILNEREKAGDQYCVYQTRPFLQACKRRGTDKRSLSIWSCEIAYHAVRILSLQNDAYRNIILRLNKPGNNPCKESLKSFHTCSMGLRSGEWGGQHET